MAYRKKSGACCRVPNSADIEVNEACHNPPYLDLGGRGQQRGQTIVFLEGVLQRTKQLAEVLEWLTATQQSIRSLKEQGEATGEDVASTCISNTKNNLEKSLTDVDSCIQDLDYICGRLFNVEVTGTKKDESALNMSGDWMWWREKTMDAKTVKCIQFHQPPSVEDVLNEPCLAIKSSTELSFMLQDIVNSMDLNKPMKTAFRFAKLGLHNLNQALQARTIESRRRQAEVEELRRADCRLEMAQLNITFLASKLKLSTMEAELSSCKGQNLALLSEIQEMQQNCITTHQQKPLPEVSPQEIWNVSSSKQNTETLSTRRRLPPSPRKSLSQTAETAQHMAVVEEEFVYEERKTEKEQSIIDQLEKKCANLLKEFENSVFKMIDKCRKGGGMDNKALDLVQVHSVLQSIIKSSFQELVYHLDDMVTESIVTEYSNNSQTEYSNNSQTEYSNNSGMSPGYLLHDLSEGLKQHERSMEETSHTIDGLSRSKQQNLVNIKGQSVRHALGSVMAQLRNVNDKGKKQICKMREQTPESVMDEHSKTSIFRDIDKSLALKKSSLFLMAIGTELPVSPKLSDIKTREVGEEKVNHVCRYIKEMAAIAEERVKEEKALQGRRNDHIWVLLIDSQRTNLKLLSQAANIGGISGELYKLSKDLIMDAFCSIEQRMAFLCRRFIRRRALRDLRKQLNARFLRAKDLEDGRSLKCLYSAFQKLDSYESDVLGRWHKRQVSIERKRSIRIAEMRYLFPQAQWETDKSLHGMRLAGDTPLATPGSPCHIPRLLELNVNGRGIGAQGALQDR
ncbi:uncharacterized protein LOC130402390 [Gadus chalcogrammus]|uniref:uncharacterized protein LOC130402390 n=1 Tax=Gadus chalcogrammus TaxID=1042646 RepID=UPI0024C4CCC1|nr:uncharacterized protein LOC130402390 [Gadus chalcogrammus]